MKEKLIIYKEIGNEKLIFNTSAHCFSPRQIDRGTLAMLSVLQLKSGLKVLDLGCGYGVVGIVCAKAVGATNVFMVDNNPKAVALSRENARVNQVQGVKIVQSDGFNTLTEAGFDLILSNPPYHADFAVPKQFIEKGFNRLKLGGQLVMVTKRKQWYKQKLISIFGGVLIREVDGYYVFCAEKRNNHYHYRGSQGSCRSDGYQSNDYCKSSKAVNPKRGAR